MFMMLPRSENLAVFSLELALQHVAYAHALLISLLINFFCFSIFFSLLFFLLLLISVCEGCTIGFCVNFCLIVKQIGCLYIFYIYYSSSFWGSVQRLRVFYIAIYIYIDSAIWYIVKDLDLRQARRVFFFIYSFLPN